MNYSELVQRIQDYAEYTETSFVANIPVFVRQAEERIKRSVRLPELRKNATATLRSNSQYLARPSDFLAPYSLAVIKPNGDYVYLLQKDVSFIREFYPSPSDTGEPRFYAQFDGDSSGTEGNFIIGPTSDVDYTAELHYYYDPESIVDAGTSWFGENAEAVLLYGSLVEAYTYMKGDPAMLQLVIQRYQTALQQLGALAVQAEDDTYRR
jgi:hypothetical protein